MLTQVMPFLCVVADSRRVGGRPIVSIHSVADSLFAPFPGVKYSLLDVLMKMGVMELLYAMIVLLSKSCRCPEAAVLYWGSGRAEESPAADARRQHCCIGVHSGRAEASPAAGGHRSWA
jgi:hypothetical protein